MENKHTWYTIVNPAGGNGTVQKRWPRIEAALLQAGVRFEVVFTEARGHATELARNAVESGWRHILAVGGDGTNNETVNGILQQQAVPPSEVCYALLPVGTGNDWCAASAFQNGFPTGWICSCKGIPPCRMWA
ncbi:MAG: acylglycerol kinase family protein [Saprospirales bacterium]|nr:acylglycerol kinase family protein [Saprospirales bacterium]